MLPLSYNLRNLTVRRATTLVTAAGIALVVFVLAASLMLAEGVRKTVATSGRHDVAIVLRKGSSAELESSVEAPTVGLLLSQPGVARNAAGEGNGVGELIMVIALEKLGSEGATNVQLRGVPDNVLEFRSHARIVAGRAAAPGTDEVVVGKRIAGRFRGLALGERFELKKNRFATVVGVFESGGDAFESEVWADLNTIRTSFGREGFVSAVRVALESADAFHAFEASVERDKNLGLEAMREDEFYEKQSEATSTFMGILGTTIAVFFSLGAMIGAMITMYGAVANRTRELGTMRALGFSRRTLLLAILIESTALAIAGGVLGLLASLGLGFIEISMMNFATWSEIVFKFEPTPRILLTSLLFALGMGLTGGLLPAIRAARVSPVAAMRA